MAKAKLYYKKFTYLQDKKYSHRVKVPGMINNNQCKNDIIYILMK